MLNDSVKQHVQMTPHPKNGQNIFGDPLGFIMTREPIQIDFSKIVLRFFNLLRDAFVQSFSAKKIKNFWICFLRTAVFQNLSHIPDQTKPNQSIHSGILHFAKHRQRAYHGGII